MTVQEACAACDTPLAGRYCHDCGQDTRAKAQPLRDMIKDVTISYSPIDGKLARTLGVLLARPGLLLEAYRRGAGSLYVTPLKLFVAATALFLAVLNFSATSFYQGVWIVEPGAAIMARSDPEGLEVTVTGAEWRERWLQPRIEPAVDPRMTKALEAAVAAAPTRTQRAALQYEIAALGENERVGRRLSAWLPNMLWLLMPLYAVGLMPFFGRRRLFLEHVIFAMWAHSVVFVLAMAVAGVNGLGANLSPSWIVPPYLAYVTLAASRYYGMPRFQALWRGTVHMVAYIALVLLPVSLIVYIVGMDWVAWGEWLTT